MRKINMFRINNKLKELLEYKFSDTIKSNRLLLFSNYLQEDIKIINEFLISEYQKLGYKKIRIIRDYNPAGYYMFYIYTDIESYNISFQNTTVSCEIGQHTILDIAFKSNEINEILNKYKYASESYEEKINNLVDSYNLPFKLEGKSCKFYLDYYAYGKIALHAKAPSIQDDDCIFLTKYFCYYDYLCAKHWLQQRTEEIN